MGALPLSRDRTTGEFRFHIQSPVMVYSMLIFGGLLVSLLGLRNNFRSNWIYPSYKSRISASSLVQVWRWDFVWDTHNRSTWDGKQMEILSGFSLAHSWIFTIDNWICGTNYPQSWIKGIQFVTRESSRAASSSRGWMARKSENNRDRQYTAIMNAKLFNLSSLSYRSIQAHSRVVLWMLFRDLLFSSLSIRYVVHCRCWPGIYRQSTIVDMYMKKIWETNSQAEQRRFIIFSLFAVELGRISFFFCCCSVWMLMICRESITKLPEQAAMIGEKWERTFIAFQTQLSTTWRSSSKSQPHTRTKWYPLSHRPKPHTRLEIFSFNSHL